MSDRAGGYRYHIWIVDGAGSLRQLKGCYASRTTARRLAMIRPENFEVRQCNPGFYGTNGEDCVRYKIRTNNPWEADSVEVCACETCASQD